MRLVSGVGVHREVEPYLDLPWVELAEPVDDLRAEYRRARVALAPASRATGFKTTVLQAWTAGCPVVCSVAVAATIGSSGRDAVLVGDSPDSLVRAMHELWSDQPRRASLAKAGIRLAAEEFADEDQRGRIVSLVHQAIGARRR